MNDSPPQHAAPLPPPGHLALWAAAFEGGVGLAAIALGWLLGFRPLALLSWSGRGLAWGAAAGVVPLAVVGLWVRFPLGPMRNLVRLVDESVAPLFGECNLIDMAGIALLAGIGEELAFRGLLQAGLAHWMGGHAGMLVGLVTAALLFALLHWLSAAYALLAGLIGLYLGGLLIVSGNLLVPMTAHAVYDFVMLVYLVRIRRHGASKRARPPIIRGR